MKDTKELMPSITECEVWNCTFNNEHKCHALAINVGGEEKCPQCDTFLQLNSKSGVQDMIAGVGACKVQNCRYNKMLECIANGIKVKMHLNHPDCATFLVR